MKPMLDPRITAELREIQTRLTNSGALVPQPKLQQYYATFRARFGIDRLQSLDGEELLITMKGLTKENRDTLPYWLEFKNDEEFPPLFGSISGGSALKYGVYPSAQTGEWMGPGARNKPKPISLTEAITIARDHRDQLVRGVKLLEAFPAHSSDDDYRRLQAAMDAQAPAVSAAAWGHKYFSLLFPDKLDDYHVAEHQRFNLVRLLQDGIPPAQDGRFITAGRYVALARELEMPLNHFTNILYRRTERPYSYWRLMANNAQANGWVLWPKLLEESIVAIGWDNVGDLSHLGHDKQSKDELNALMQQHYNAYGRWSTELFHFVTLAAPGDIVFAMQSDTVLGIGRITGPYQFAKTDRGSHQRRVDWLDIEPWQLPVDEKATGNWRQLRDYRNWLEAEMRMLGKTLVVVHPQAPTPTTVRRAPELQGIAAKIHGMLQRKGQIILYGPPGTGKTFQALRAAREIVAYTHFSRAYDELSADEQLQLLIGPTAAVTLITFHPGYGYEDFIEGYRPQAGNGAVNFQLRDGIFKQLVARAQQQPQKPYFLVIDEINRGDIPRIFGELLTLLEVDKRGETVILPLSGQCFAIPPNLHIIATMNTADRSIALLDAALRRRFGFLELLPDYTLLQNQVIESIPLDLWLQELNQRLVEAIGRDARNLQIGHAYLMPKGRPVTNFTEFARILQEEIIPLLEEYTYEDYRALEQILGSSFIDNKRQRVRHDLFSGGRDELLQAILAPTPDLITTQQATAADDGNAAGLADDEEDDQTATPALG